MRNGKPYPGPRCATHAREHKRQVSLRAHSVYVENEYGIKGDEYWALYEFQGGKCAICWRALGKTKRLAVDHDHSLESQGMCTAVRGLLCSNCNNMLGHGRDSTEFFQRAIDYLRQPPAREVLQC